MALAFAAMTAKLAVIAETATTIPPLPESENATVPRLTRFLRRPRPAPAARADASEHSGVAGLCKPRRRHETGVEKLTQVIVEAYPPAGRETADLRNV